MNNWHNEQSEMTSPRPAVRVPVRVVGADTAPEKDRPLAFQSDPCQDEAAVWRERYARAAADLENHKKRLARQYAGQAEQEKDALVRDLLPAADSLERALAQPSHPAADASLRRGVELTLQSFHDALRRHGIVAVNPEGEPFDPELHEAVGVISAPSLPPGTVARVERRGYSVGERLLRPARVLVTPN